jgi:ACR3 family arsenite efflux pump ArsB
VRACSLLGILVSFFGLLYAIGIVIGKLIFQFRVEGWSSLMVVILIVSGVQMMMIGVLGEYLWRNLEETRRRPRYIVEKIVEGGDTL